jgi:predicted RNase H-like nuclease
MAEDHATAVATNRRIAGEGISIQAFGLKAKLFERAVFRAQGGQSRPSTASLA